MIRLSKTVATPLLFISVAAAGAFAQQPATTQSGDDFVQLASTFVKAMRFSDADKTEHVTKLTADYLRQLQWLLDQRKAALDKLGQGDKTPEVNLQTADAYRVTRNSTIALRDAYVARLNGLMTPYQVERIKDGITGDWLHITLQNYEEMIPALTHAQRAHILGLLTEMRENAMMELGVGPQEQWVHKYRGIINNYIAKQGHDFNTLAKQYDEKQNAKKNAEK